MRAINSFVFFTTAIVNKNLQSIDCFIALDMFFGRYGHSTLTTSDKSSKRIVVRLFRSLKASLFYYLLNTVKKFLCDKWLVDSLMDFSVIAKIPKIKRIGEKKFDSVFAYVFFTFGKNTLFCQKVTHILKSIASYGI
ncbi:hypothetical protein HY612_00155 [Candidatus Roizmanbacteria bacterium]|nr:hypothetical protein [Candidatus Roizmanbacteria bacterium]